MKPVHFAALVLAIIGAINWGLVGLFQFDLVAVLFGGAAEPLSRVVYVLVGIAGVVLIFTSTAIFSNYTYGQPTLKSR